MHYQVAHDKDQSRAVRAFERQDFEIELINIGCVYQLVAR